MAKKSKREKPTAGLYTAQELLKYLRLRIKAGDVDYATAALLLKQASDRIILDKVRPTDLVKAGAVLEPDPKKWAKCDKFVKRAMRYLKKLIKKRGA